MNYQPLRSLVRFLTENSFSTATIEDARRERTISQKPGFVDAPEGFEFAE